MKVRYSGASTGVGYHLAAAVTSGDRALYYGRIKSLAAAADKSGDVTFTIPEYKSGEEVYLFVEGNNNNGDGKTDFAGVPVRLTGNGRDIKALSPDVLLDLKSISVDPSPVTLTAGKTATLNVGYSPADAKEDIGWISSAPDIVSVDGAGKLTAHKAGTATITATISLAVQYHRLLHSHRRDTPLRGAQPQYPESGADRKRYDGDIGIPLSRGYLRDHQRNRVARQRRKDT